MLNGTASKEADEPAVPFVEDRWKYGNSTGIHEYIKT